MTARETLRAIARVNPERWPDANLRTLINEMQHAAIMALRRKGRT